MKRPLKGRMVRGHEELARKFQVICYEIYRGRQRLKDDGYISISDQRKSIGICGDAEVGGRWLVLVLARPCPLLPREVDAQANLLM
jgi:hypothetical protein